MDGVFGINLWAILEYNLVVLTITTIFFSLSNIRSHIFKSLEKYKQEITSDDRTAKNRLEIIANKENINMHLEQKAERVLKLIDRMGFVFRQSIYCTFLALIFLLVFCYRTSLFVPHNSYFSVINGFLIILFSFLASWQLAVNVHSFKYIYHFDASMHRDYSKMIQKMIDCKEGYNIEEIQRRINKYTEDEKLKLHWKKRLEYLMPVNLQNV